MSSLWLQSKVIDHNIRQELENAFPAENAMSAVVQNEVENMF